MRSSEPTCSSSANCVRDRRNTKLTLKVGHIRALFSIKDPVRLGARHPFLESRTITLTGLKPYFKSKSKEDKEWYCVLLTDSDLAVHPYGIMLCFWTTEADKT